jgi:ketosteroid isomerase-like protein
MHRNESTMRRLLRGFDGGALDPESFLAAVSPDLVWRVVGQHAASLGLRGVYTGLHEVSGFLAEARRYRRNYEVLEVVSLTANAQIGLSVHRAAYDDPAGQRHEIEEVWTWHFQRGKVTEIWDYDQAIHRQMVERGERRQTGFEPEG